MCQKHLHNQDRKPSYNPMKSEIHQESFTIQSYLESNLTHGAISFPSKSHQGPGGSVDTIHYKVKSLVLERMSRSTWYCKYL